MSASCQLTCRGRVSLPEYIHVDAYGRANPAPAWILADIHKKIVSGQKRLLIEMNAFAANQIYRIMYSSEDLERFCFQYQTETCLMENLSNRFVSRIKSLITFSRNGLRILEKSS